MTTAASRRKLKSDNSASRADMATYLDQASRAARKLAMNTTNPTAPSAAGSQRILAWLSGSH